MKQLQTLDAWRVSRDLAIEAYRVTLRTPLAKHWGLADQVRRCAVSIPSNVAEGYALGTKPQLVRGVRIALASAAELRTQLDISHELNLIGHDDAAALLAKCDRAIALMVGFLRKLGARPGR
jgi:four helix bundle protein